MQAIGEGGRDGRRGSWGALVSLLPSIWFSFTPAGLRTVYFLCLVFLIGQTAPLASVEGGLRDHDLAEDTSGARPKRVSYRVTRTEVAPEIDGVLDDAIWKQARQLGELRQVEPVAGGTASEGTEVTIAYDDYNVYLAVRCFDSDPGAILATQAKRDATLDPDDRVEFLFDPFLDRRNAFWFQVGAGGSKGDALLTRNGASFNKQWDGIWYGRSRIDELGWTMEVAIPTRTLNFDPEGSAWGFNVRRFIRRKNEEVRWASPEPRLRFFAAANAGTVEGFEGLKQGLGLDIKPFAVVERNYDDSDGTERADVDIDFDAGLDLFYSLTPNTKLSLSFNTDFAETEVDERRVNLTRFPLFFPEKRDFFLEDSGVFFFGPSRQRDAIPFFSRRIGLSSGGEVPLLAAAKLTGRSDGWSYGLLNVQTDSFSVEDDDGNEEDVSGQNLSVARVSRDILEQSDMGFVLTHGDPSGETGSGTWGVDANLRTDRFLGDRNLQLSTYVQGSESSSDDGDGSAWFA
ncbi:MAG: hypothetical protein ACI8PQ_001409, partial [Planctomycetota bacterium]